MSTEPKPEGDPKPDASSTEVSNAEVSKADDHKTDAAGVEAEGDYSLAESSSNEPPPIPPEPTDAVLVESAQENDSWWRKLLAFLGTSTSAIIGLLVASLAGYFYVKSLVFGVPEYETDWETDWFGFIGRFHLLVLHLPIGGVAYLIFLEACRLFQWFESRKRKLHRVPVLLFTAITAVLAAGMGYSLALTGIYTEKEAFNEHLLYGLFFTFTTGIALFFGALSTQWQNFFSRVGYLLSILLVVYTVARAGHSGGDMVHGDGFLYDKAPEFMHDPIERMTGYEFPEVTEVVDPYEAAAIPKEEREIFAQVIAPVLQVHCVKCHGPDLSYGGSRMDSYALLAKGGGYGPSFVAGDPDNSNIIKRMELPQSDGAFMPPLTGGVPLPSEQTILLLREWIALGAPEAGKLGEFEFSEAALSAVPELDASGEAKEPEMTQEQKDKQAAEEFAQRQLAKREELVPVVEQLGAELGTSSLLFNSRDTPQLSFNGFSIGQNLNEEMLESLSPVASELVELNLRATALDDQMALSLPADLPQLQILDVSQTAITDQGVNEIVSRAPLLQRLVAYETQVGDGIFSPLLERSDLEFLSLKTTAVTQSGVEQFLGQRPEVKVLHEPLEPNPEAAAIKQREAEEFARGERK